MVLILGLDAAVTGSFLPELRSLERFQAGGAPAIFAGCGQRGGDTSFFTTAAHSTHNDQPWRPTEAGMVDYGAVFITTAGSPPMVLATDRVGLSIIRSAGALACPDTINEAIKGYELASSTAILAAGYNLASMMVRYRGVDWRQHREVACNARLNPYLDKRLPLDPFEVVFVKAKSDLQVPSSAFHARYTRYNMRDSAANVTVAELQANV